MVCNIYQPIVRKLYYETVKTSQMVSGKGMWLMCPGFYARPLDQDRSKGSPTQITLSSFTHSTLCTIDSYKRGPETEGYGNFKLEPLFEIQYL